MKKRVLVNKPIHPQALEKLKQEAEVLTPYTLPDSEVYPMLADVHGLVLMMGLNMTGPIMDKCKTLEVIGRHGVGLDNVDVEAATQHGIAVVYTPEAPTESTAEHAFTLMMAVARQLTFLDRETRRGNFHVRDGVIGREMRGVKVGVVGFGRIGKRFAEMCRGALETPIFVYDPWQEKSKVEAWGATYCSDLVEMASQVDAISLHCPATPQTHHLVNQQVLNAMKPNAILINAARGPVVDEAALFNALQEKRIGGAGLDVYDPEPPKPNNPLFGLDNIVLSPHLASMTDGGRFKMGMTVVEEVLRVLKGETPLFPVNPQVLKNKK